MAKIVIVGAGLTGLSAAYHLEKRGFFDYKLYEKDARIGGLCRSVVQDGFTFDYTGHLLHTSDPYFKGLIDRLFGLDNLNSINRRSFIYSEETYTKYPYQVNLYGLSSKTIAECIEGFVLRKKSRKKNLNFHEWVLENFGQGIAKHFFVPYQTKIFDYNVTKLTSTWMGRFVPNTSLEEIIDGIVNHNKKEDPKKIGYNAHFYYPKEGGIISWVSKLADALKRRIITQCGVLHIDAQKKIVYFDDGTHEEYDTLITTMPLDTLLENITMPADVNFRSAAKKLVCNGVINFNLGFNRPDISDKHWIYFPESKYPFYRIGFPHNFAESMAPEGCSSLYGEFSYTNRPEAEINKKLKQALKQTKKILNLSDSDIATEKIINIPRAYVIYDFWREKNLGSIHKRLEENHIYSVGRYGEWKYSSMQEAVLDGKKIAEKLTVMPAKQAFYKMPYPAEKTKEI